MLEDIGICFGMPKNVAILFVCHGNICRSPMAEFVMKDMVAKEGLADNFIIASSAVSSEEIGNPVYPPVKRLLSANGISCEGKFARKMTPQDYDNFDLLIGMDNDNIRRMYRICSGDSDGKIRSLKSFTGNPNGEVADPWYSGDFTATWNDVVAGCSAILQAYKNGKL